MTAFSLIHAKYQFKRIPFGLQIGLSQLAAFLDQIFNDIKFDYVMNFCHLKHLEEVVTRLSKHNLTVSIKKAKFFCTQISFLGNIVSLVLIPKGIDIFEG